MWLIKKYCQRVGNAMCFCTEVQIKISRFDTFTVFFFFFIFRPSNPFVTGPGSAGATLQSQELYQLAQYLQVRAFTCCGNYTCILLLVITSRAPTSLSCRPSTTCFNTPNSHSAQSMRGIHIHGHIYRILQLEW